METNASFKDYLRQEFIKRTKNNESYSLRAFAKNIGIPASSLSLILKGSRPLTNKMKEKIGLSLGLKLDQIIQMESDQKLAKYRKIELRAFQYISDWYHYAILELTKLRHFESDIKWISKTLGISKQECELAIENLEELNLLDKSKRKWFDKSEDGNATNISSGLSSQASKLLQKQLLTKSLSAIDTVPLEHRNHTSLTIAVNKKDVQKVKNKITTFRRELNEMLEESKNKDSVYQFTFSMFPLSLIEEKK